ncbi:hypothetical protein HMPREF2863_05045 [Micrococcus sp. HMSC067E09]|uniref:DUF6414 family protein n=1 Tax=Micrococcus sp. HMSC067E09 TaxID=1739367 RepID=UPI0008A10DA2|nr:hypothetical protein [Micrococcus sp. HMSC067E09]OFR91177.1 hypothetical protein HMPREF2863_05045 [Micrococcus sp. HMSC067E09]
MPLRNPLYLDAESLYAYAQYSQIEPESIKDVVERHRNTKEATAKAGVPGANAQGGGALEVEVQHSYTLAPKQKAAVSRSLDELIREEAILTLGGQDRAPEKDDLVHAEGRLVMTPTSLAGKMLEFLRQHIGDDDGTVSALMAGEGLPDAALGKVLRDAYFKGTLPNIPLLMELRGTGYQGRVFVSLPPSGFVDVAQAEHIEGNRRVLGQVEELIGGGNEGYLSAEKWLLSRWDYMMRRLMMAQMTGTVEKLIDNLGIELEVHDVHATLQGPAVILNAVMVY